MKLRTIADTLILTITTISIFGATTSAAQSVAATGQTRATSSALAGYTIRLKDTNLCLTAPGAPNGGVLLLIQCGGWLPNEQKWFMSFGTTFNRITKVSNTSACLEVGGFSIHDGAAAMTWSCTGKPNQQWQVLRNAAGWWEIRNQNSARCLDARYTAEWISPYQWGCHGGSEQQWIIEAA
jgi:hypothetical protein